MNKRERMIQKIEAEPDQERRIMMYVMFIGEYASEEVNNIIEDMLDRVLQDGKNSAAICAEAMVKLERISAAA